MSVFFTHILKLVATTCQNLLICYGKELMDSIGEFFPVLIEQTAAVIPPMLKCLLLFPQNLLVSLVELLNFLLVLQLVFCALTCLFCRLSFSSCRVIMLDTFFYFLWFLDFFLALVTAHP